MTPAPIVLRLLLPLIALVALATPAAAQVDGTVRDERGALVDGAIVELWDGSQPVARAITSDAGRFSFPADSIPAVALLVARRTGYQPRRLPVPAARPAVVEIRLQVAAHALAPVVVQADEDCSTHDHPHARTAWERVRSRYRQPDSLDMAVRSSKYVGRVPSAAEQVLDGMRPTVHSYWAAGIRHSQTRDQILASGYAHRMTGVNMDPEFDAWSYVQLYRYPQHFSDELFGRLHAFTVVSERDDELVLRFCPHRLDRPAIEGLLVLTRDGVLKEAEWLYRMPPERQHRRRRAHAWPEERAGGRVVIGPDRPGPERPVLLPQSALYWRTTHHGDYYYNWEEFTEWRVAPARVP